MYTMERSCWTLPDGRVVSHFVCLTCDHSYRTFETYADLESVRCIQCERRKARDLFRDLKVSGA